MNSTTLCQLCDRPLEVGYLCTLCTKRTRVRLEALPVLYAGLVAFLARSGASGQGRAATPTFAPLPVSEDILDLRGPGGLVVVATGWADSIRGERGMTAAVRPGSIDGQLREAVAELLGHLPWVELSWPEAGTFARDIQEVTRSVSSIFAPSEQADRGTRLGRCVARRGDGTSCGATLRLRTGEKAVRCEWCGTVYPPATWAQVKAWQDEDDAATAQGDASAAPPPAAVGTTR
ncbi:hypothetical protein [Streptomyces liangshanensis]|uniref:hypothetical protein n=1 Tax=Streptomyces liangshanensis TaxID=2717324 RepID=UPI0036DD5FF6